MPVSPRAFRVVAVLTVAASIAVPVASKGGPSTAGAATASQCGSHPWCNTKLSPAKRATLLEDAMSSSDKIAMLTGGAASDVGVPKTSFSDGAVGVRTTGSGNATAFPAGIALAANFDPTMATAYGSAIGAELKSHGYDGDWGPNVNIMRTPLGGRTFEAYGEDPYLAGATGAHWIEGLQSQGEMAVEKHFVANDQEGQYGVSPLIGVDGARTFTNVIDSDRALHEVDLEPFAISVAQAHPAGIMCSYNQLGGKFSCDNPYELQTLLRKQIGFTGLIESDALAAHTPEADLDAGQDVDIVGNSDNAAFVQAALAAGEITQATIDARVHEYLQTLFAYGFFDRAAYTSAGAATPGANSQSVDIATEEGGATLLKNSGALPLTGTHKKILVVGVPANQYVFGFGSSQVTPYSSVTALAGIQARAAKAGDTVTYDEGTDVSQAETDAKAADVVIVVAADSETEGGDKLCMSLTPQCAPTQISTLTPENPEDEQAAWGDQDSLISDVSAANKHTVVVLETGAPVLTPWRSSVAGLLEAWYPGEDGGTAIAHVLWGDVDPGGRLPATFPANAAQEPTAGSTASYPGVPGVTVQQDADDAAVYQETFTEGIDEGYRWFNVHHETPAYAFGYGLSYSSFTFSGLHVTKTGVTLTVRNTGKRAGDAVPEVYVSLPSTKAVPEPPLQLVSYVKVNLAPGQTKTVTLTYKPRAFSYWDSASSSWRTVSGCARIYAGSSSNALPLSGTIATGTGRCH